MDQRALSREWKGNPQTGRVFTNHKSDKGLIPRLCKELIKLHKSKVTWSKYGQRTWTDIYPEKIYKWPMSIWRNAKNYQLWGKCKSNRQWDTTSHSSEWHIYPQALPSVDKGVEKLVGMENSAVTGENSAVVLQTVKHRRTVWSHESTSECLPKRTESRDLNRYLYTNVHNNVIHNSQNVETNGHQWMSGKPIRGICNHQIFSALKKIMDEILIHAAAWMNLED